MLLGQRIHELRKQKGETLKEISRSVNLSVSYLSDIERGRTKPSLQTLESLAGHFEITLTDLLSGVEFAGTITEKSLPPGLNELLKDIKLSEGIDDEWKELLIKINLRGKRPQTELEWYDLYRYLKRILESSED